ncbi:response regulator transcription factor [Candidatus Lucifugimonas marina]|uniref:Response regulator n=1 Tax=Candidatus Lucifugimonas marina TaxID=3038979 RepID=A0AAJ5ZJ75_9CHLR|nr:response regulator [SAR202 cluster bacterium JH702]MDG0870003.1 response regulator [SAR202 cluster bacterium JH639]WFG36432.1 response regulator [SAR202 cluster bacterium JH545]WFG40365.1 response regulator [SAR202 cluster bacterium JH1073]
MKVMVLHRSPLIARGLCLVLASAGIEGEEITWDGYKSLKATLDSIKPNVVLTDPLLPGIDSKRFISDVSVWNNEAVVGIISIDQSAAIVEDAVSAGANGYISLSLSDEEFVASLRLLATGQVVVTGPVVSSLADVAASVPATATGFSRLTGREAQIAELVASGLTNIKIADRLQLKDGTVKVHVRNIFRKLGIANRTELTRLAIRSGLIA